MRYFSALSLLPALLLLAACSFHQGSRTEMASLSRSQPLEEEKSLVASIRIDNGLLEISGEKAGRVFSMDLAYDKASYQPVMSYDAASGGEEGLLTFSMESMRKAGIRRETLTNQLRFNLSEELPLKLNLNSGVGTSRLSLSGLRLAALDLDCGVGGAKISAYEPNPIQCQTVRIRNGVGRVEAVGLGNLNFLDLEFEGGVGGASLDFTGDWKHDAAVRIQVGVGGVSVRMPSDLGVKVEAEKHFLSGLHLDGFSRRNGFYYSGNYDQSEIRVSLRVVTGVGGFRITWI